MNVKSVYIIIGFFISTDVTAKGIYSKTFGNYEHAVGDYLIVNNENAKVQVLGFKKIQNKQCIKIETMWVIILECMVLRISLSYENLKSRIAMMDFMCMI